MPRVGDAPLVRISNTYGVGLFAYLAVAVVSALAEWGSFIVALRFLAPVPAAIVGFVVATIINFMLSRRYVFHSKRSLPSEFILVLGLSGVAFTGNIVSFYLLYQVFDINLILAKVLGTCFGFVFNYAFRQFFVFARVSRFATISEVAKRKKLKIKADDRSVFRAKEP